MPSELCGGSGDCDSVYWKILKCWLTRVRNLDIIWSLPNTGRQLEPRGAGGKESREKRPGCRSKRMECARVHLEASMSCHSANTVVVDLAACKSEFET